MVRNAGSRRFPGSNPRQAPPDPSFLAYVGPGAGFAFLGSFLSLIAAFLVGAASLLAWPVRVLWRTLSGGKKDGSTPKVRKVIFLGLDGYDPDLAERFMSEGKLPPPCRSAGPGAYDRLRTTYPPLSPVAWSTFATGVNPAKHSLYDFLNRSMRNLSAGTLLVARAGALSFSTVRQVAFSVGQGIR